ncbi:MAG: tRNA (adenosine(37)-N6)-dimethylallyltransferase MiaA [Pontibacterium sp.]
MTEPSLPAVIFLMGPTASGKTALAMELHDQLDCEIVSVDSALIYRDMNIGTAKPDAEMLSQYPHHLVDIRDPSQTYSAAEFRRDALKLIKDIQNRGKMPLLTGGTMMYFNALQQGLAELPDADAKLRAELVVQAQTEGWGAIHARLAQVDPVSAERINPNDSQRLQRALEVYLLTGTPMSAHWEAQKTAQLPFNPISLAVMPKERSELHRRIELRFDQMLEQGFEAEARKLWERGDLDVSMPSVRCVGYRQMWNYFSGEWDYDTMRFKGIVATRQLAKRQVTWLRSWEKLNWLDTHDPDIVNNALKIIRPAII